MYEYVYVYLRVLVLDPQRRRRLQDSLELWKSRLDGWLADCHFKSGRWQCRCRQVSSYGRHNKIINNNWPLPSAGETAHGRRWRAAVAVQQCGRHHPLVNASLAQQNGRLWNSRKLRRMCDDESVHYPTAQKRKTNSNVMVEAQTVILFAKQASVCPQRSSLVCKLNGRSSSQHVFLFGSPATQLMSSPQLSPAVVSNRVEVFYLGLAGFHRKPVQPQPPNRPQTGQL